MRWLIVLALLFSGCAAPEASTPMGASADTTTEEPDAEESVSTPEPNSSQPSAPEAVAAPMCHHLSTPVTWYGYLDGTLSCAPEAGGGGGFYDGSQLAAVDPVIHEYEAFDQSLAIPAGTPIQARVETYCATPGCAYIIDVHVMAGDKNVASLSTFAADPVAPWGLYRDHFINGTLEHDVPAGAIIGFATEFRSAGSDALIGYGLAGAPWVQIG